MYAFDELFTLLMYKMFYTPENTIVVDWLVRDAEDYPEGI
jgi:hypothetical protein